MYNLWNLIQMNDEWMAGFWPRVCWRLCLKKSSGWSILICGCLVNASFRWRYISLADCGSLWCQFGITLGRVGVASTSLWGHFAHLGVGLGSLWADFWIIWGSLCSCLAYEGPFSKTLVSLCFFTILTALVWTRSHFGVMLGGFGWLWGHFWHMRLSLGNFEIT